MRLTTIFLSAAFVLAGTSAALPIERKNMLMARFSDSDKFADVEAREYYELVTRAPFNIMHPFGGGSTVTTPAVPMTSPIPLGPIPAAPAAPSTPSPQ